MALRLITPRTSGRWEEIQPAKTDQAAYTLSRPYKPGTFTLSVLVNGLLQYCNEDYAETDGLTVTFLGSLLPEDGDEIMFVHSS